MAVALLDQYRELHRQLDAATDRITTARDVRDRTAEFNELIERANVEMLLRDFWGPDTPKGQLWQSYMWMDIHAAQRLVGVMAK